MKRFVLSALLCFALLQTCMIPAFAYQVIPGGEIRPDNYTSELMMKNRQALEAHHIYGREYASFSEGLLRIFQSGVVHDEWGEGIATWDNFVDTNGKLVDLNRGRFDFMSTFSGGLSSVYKYVYDGANNHTTGFVNKNGDMVLDTSKYGSFHYYRVMTSRFVGGKALLSKSGIVDLEKLKYPEERAKYNTSEFVVIDTKGKVLETIKGVDQLIAHPLFKTSITDYDGVPLGVLMDPLAYAGTVGSSSDATPAEPIAENPNTTYGQAAVKARGYTIENNIGYLLIDVTNQGETKDQGDLFYVLYNKFNKAEGMISNTTDFLPTDYIRQIHYEVGPKSTKILRVPVGMLGQWDGDLTEENRDAGWFENIWIDDSRFILAQAESQKECAELTEFFKAAHDYGEMSLDYSTVDGITILAKPFSSTSRAAYLNKKLSAFTSQF